MAVSLRGMIHELSIEIACHSRGSFGAPANQTDAAAREPFDGRNCDIRGKALRHDLAFVERDEQDAAHFFSPRLAAAIASRALL